MKILEQQMEEEGEQRQRLLQEKHEFEDRVRELSDRQGERYCTLVCTLRLISVF